MNLLGVLKLIGRCIISGAAVSAGSKLYNDLLDGQIRKISSKLKHKLDNRKK